MIKYHLLIAVLVLILPACSEKKPETMPETNSAAATDAEDLITLSPAQFESSAMQTGQMSDQVFSKAIKANGMIDVPPENQASVSAYFAGYVKDIRLLPGEKVAKGQLLFTLENPDYVGMQQDYLEAKGQLSYLKADYERQKTLAEDNVTSQKNFLKAESEYNVTMARFESLKKKLSLMNIDPGQVSEGNLRSTINIVAPISGYITGVNANKGMFLNPSDVAVTITNVDHVHLELNVFEKDIQLVKEGQLIRFNSVESGGKLYEATVHLVGRTVDPATRIVNIHGHLADENQSSLFPPGMYIEAEIIVDGKTAKALPRESVVGIEDKYYVLLKRSSGDDLTFEKAEVQVGRMENGFAEILNAAAFGPDDEFLTVGAFSLISE